MPTHCCVPLCTLYGYVDSSGRKVSYHKFPTDAHLKKRWISAIRRDEGPQFKVSQATKVCSKHFIESDYWTSMAGSRRLLRDTAVPSVFAFRKVKPARKPPLQRSACPVPARRKHPRSSSNSQDHRAQAVFGEDQNQAQDADQEPSSTDVFHESQEHSKEGGRENQPPPQDTLQGQQPAPDQVFHENQAPLQEIFPCNEIPLQERAVPSQCKCNTIILALQAELATRRENELRLQKDVDTLLAKSKENELTIQAALDTQLAKSRSYSKLQSELQIQLEANKSSEPLRIELQQMAQKVSEQNKELDLLRDELVLAQRKMETLREESAPFGIEKFQESDQDIQFYTGLPKYSSFVFLLEYLNPGEDGENIRRHQKTSNGHQTSHDYCGRRRKITVANQLFLVLVKLRLGLFHQHLGHLFSVSTSTVSRIFASWIDFMYLQMTPLAVWLPRQTIDAAMPEAFKKKYPSTRVLLDATEIRCDVPSSFVTQTEVYSHYKSAHTFKGLVGVSPSGLLTFVSELFTGCTSDRECVIRSGFLTLDFDPGDSVMADKGFRIEDLLKDKGVNLNIPPFLKQGQLTAKETQDTQEIAALRIHVERKIQRIKGYHVFDRSIPMSLAPLANQMWAICAVLTNLQAPLLKEVED